MLVSWSHETATSALRFLTRPGAHPPPPGVYCPWPSYSLHTLRLAPSVRSSHARPLLSSCAPGPTPAHGGADACPSTQNVSGYGTGAPSSSLDSAAPKLVQLFMGPVLVLVAVWSHGSSGFEQVHCGSAEPKRVKLWGRCTPVPPRVFQSAGVPSSPRNSAAPKLIQLWGRCWSPSRCTVFPPRGFQSAGAPDRAQGGALYL